MTQADQRFYRFLAACIVWCVFGFITGSWTYSKLALNRLAPASDLASTSAPDLAPAASVQWDERHAVVFSTGDFPPERMIQIRQHFSNPDPHLDFELEIVSEKGRELFEKWMRENGYMTERTNSSSRAVISREKRE